MSLELSDKHVLMTGGTGLVGSRLAAHLPEDNYVVVADDFSKGNRKQVPGGIGLVQADMADPDDVVEVIAENLDIIFHFTAYTDTNYGNPRQLFGESTEMAYNILKRMQGVDVSDVAPTSSSAIYDEAPRPTPKDYASLELIGIYDSFKLTDEGLLLTFTRSYDFTIYICRFANIVGPSQCGNVIPDFTEKLLKDPETLEILGNGRQEKSYLHVEDYIDATYHVVEHADRDCNVYNPDTRTTTSVTIIANIVADMLDFDPESEYTSGNRGWIGDVLKVRLSIEKLSALGWEPGGSNDKTVHHVVEELAAELHAEHE